MAPGVLLSETVELLGLNVQTFLVFCVAFLLTWLFVKRPRNLPPYPAGWRPVLGHLLALGRAPHVKLTEWRQQYGDVFTVRMGMEDVVVLNGYTAVKDAVVDRSELFASRPPNYVFDVVTGFGKGIGGGQWGNEFKKKRRLVSTVLKTLGMKMGVGSIEDKIREEAECVCTKVAEYKGEAFDIEGDLHVAIANVICSMVIGHRFDYDDERIRELSEAACIALAKMGSAQLISVFPFLRFIPGVNRPIGDASQHSGKILTFLRKEIAHHRRDLDRSNPKDLLDFCLIELERQEKAANLSEEQVIHTAQDLILGGIDTLSNTMRWSLLYMVLNSDVQQKVQAEIDAVVGGNLPSLSHRSQMPYTEATLLEIQRIREVAPLAIPHATTQDVKVGQFDVPMGTKVLLNLHSLHNDPTYWSDPDRFDPARFLDGNGKVVNTPKSFMPFSGGRRVCIGEQLAKIELFLLFSALLQNFTFKLPEGAPPLSTEGTLGLTLNPHSYKLCATPR